MSKSISDKSILGALTVNNKNVPIISYSDTTPTSPAVGDLWFNTSNGYTYLYYNDGSSSQWVSISTSGAGAQGIISATSPLSYNSSTQNISLSTVGVASGGTGATDAAGARTNLDAAQTAHVHSASDITSGSLAIARGGTGGTTGSGMIAMIPSAVYVSSGSGSVAADGTVSFSGCNAMAFAGAFSSAYDRYLVQVSGYSGPGSYIAVRGAVNGGGANAAAYYEGGFYRQGGTVGIWTNASGVDKINVGYAPSNEWWGVNIEVVNPNTGNAPTFQTRAFYHGGSGTSVLCDAKYNGGAYWDGLQIHCSSGGTFSGTVRIFAYRK